MAFGEFDLRDWAVAEANRPNRYRQVTEEDEVALAAVAVAVAGAADLVATAVDAVVAEEAAAAALAAALVATAVDAAVVEEAAGVRLVAEVDLEEVAVALRAAVAVVAAHEEEGVVPGVVPRAVPTSLSSLTVTRASSSPRARSISSSPRTSCPERPSTPRSASVWRHPVRMSLD